jgi:CO/xanthine dehydrogenase Mo-binding subunit
MDQVAAAIGLTPEEFRRRNFIKEGETTATSQVIREKVDLGGLLNRAFELTDYHAKRKRFAEENIALTKHAGGVRTRRGIGFAAFMHGAGFTGSGEVFLQSVVGAEATAAGHIKVLAASTEIGQGTNTIFAQIAAETLGLDYDLVEVIQPDTAQVPNSGPTVASRTCMIVGKLVESAVLGLKQTLVGSGLLKDQFTQSEFQRACGDYIAKHGALKNFSQYQPPPNVHWDDEKYQGDAYGAFAWAVYVAEVSYDRALRPGKLQGRSDEFAWTLSIMPFEEAEPTPRQAGPWAVHQLVLTVSWPHGRRIELQTLRMLRTQ